MSVGKAPVKREVTAGTSASPISGVKRTVIRSLSGPADAGDPLTDAHTLFWRRAHGGCVALQQGDRWIAQLCAACLWRQIEALTSATDGDDAYSSADEGDLDETIAIQTAPALWDTYRALIGEYRAHTAQRALSPAASQYESMVDQMVANAASADGAATEAITLRSLSIVLPAYNEEMVIPQTIDVCLKTAARFCPNAEVIVVDDGGRDRTGAIIDEIAANDARVVAVHHTVNRGYGAAVLSGFAAARGDLLFFMDSDGQFDIEDIAILLREEAQRPGVVVLGYREHRQDSPVRKLNAWGWKQLVGVVLGLRGIRDIDCAFKLFPTALVRACEVVAEGAMVNTELLVKLKRINTPMVQVSVSHFQRTHGKATGANLRVIARAFNELVRLRLRLHRWRVPAGVLHSPFPAASSDAHTTAPSITAHDDH